MPGAIAEETVTIALIGNPNTGKSTLFSALAGIHQRVGNYPGVTVERKIGHITLQGRKFALVDLPGTYSLAPRSPDEMVTVDVLLGRRDDTPRPAALLCIVDASNLERNLFLVSQALELGLPTILALNMVDVARERGIKLNVPRLAERLGVTVVEVQANRKLGIETLKSAILAAIDRPAAQQPSPFPPAFQQEVARLANSMGSRGDGQGSRGVDHPRYLVERLLLDTSGYIEQQLLSQADDQAATALREARERLAQANCKVPAIEAVSRYAWVGRMLEGLVERPARRRVSPADKLDRVLTHRVWGSLGLLLIMLLIFQSVFSFARWPMSWIQASFDGLAGIVESGLDEGALRSLLVDGLLGGFGGVLIFLPQIMILFFFIAILEDCGYMARAAYLMDKLMSKVGLSGKSFIPLLSSFACAIPGVMATRVIENWRDRLTTILVAPLMSCSARVPVYAMLIAAFVPDRAWLGGLLRWQALTFVAMYLVGILAAALVALILKRTLLRGPTPPFVMELPAYKWPSARMVLFRMVDRGWAFVRRASTLIVAVSVVVWAALYYPHDEQAVRESLRRQETEIQQQLARLSKRSPKRRELRDRLAQLERPEALAGEFRRQSALGRCGHWIEPVVKPLGWDWRIGCAVIASFPAREVVVATLGIIYNLGSDLDVENQEDASRLQGALRRATWDHSDRKVFNLPVALSIMVFFALCAQCASTLVVIKRETNSWFWPAFTLVYMTTLAWIGAWITYQVGTWLS